MTEIIPFGSALYFVMLALLLFARGMDFLSTWVATPTLALEANPVARRLGWRWGLIVNGLVCAAFAAWPLPAIIIATTSVLVAARNFQSAWLMRALGEDRYRFWIAERLAETGVGLYVLCLFGQTLLVAAVGAAVIYFSQTLVPFAVGTGIVTYAGAVVFFTLLSLRRFRKCAVRTNLE